MSQINWETLRIKGRKGFMPDFTDLNGWEPLDTDSESSLGCASLLRDISVRCFVTCRAGGRLRKG